MSKKRLKRLLKRDGNRCGIHYFGCEKKLITSEATTGHIVPKSLAKDFNSFDPFPRGLKRRIAKNPKFSMSIRSFPQEMNVQPMCKECNRKMAAKFPAQPIVESKCDCCSWIYIKHSKDRLNPILPSSFVFDKTRGWLLKPQEGEICLLRVTWYKGRGFYLAYPLGGYLGQISGQNEYGRKEYFPEFLMVWASNNARREDRVVFQAGDQRGCLIPTFSMAENNLRYSAETLTEILHVPGLASVDDVCKSLDKKGE